MVVQLFGFAYAWFRYDSRVAILTFLLLLYGPAAALANLSFGSVTLPLGSAVALLGILYTSKCAISKHLFYYAAILVSTCIMIAIINFDLYILVMTTHFLIYALCGLMVGNFIASRPEPVRDAFLKAFCTLGSLGFLCVIVFRMFLVDGTGQIHSRDVGFGMLPIFVLFLTILNNRGLSLQTAPSLLYLGMSQTRSLLGVLVIGFIYGRKLLGFNKHNFLFLVSSVFGIVALVLLMSLRFEGQSDAVGAEADFAQKLSLVSRINGAVNEWDTFKASPIIGKGIAYYEKAYREKKAAEKKGVTSIDSVAYNHVGIISVAAQGGIALFILVIGVPLYLIIKLRPVMAGAKDKIFVACFLILVCYVITFFVSGSPVRKDYNDALLYYFVIGYLMRHWSSLKAVEKSTW